MYKHKAEYIQESHNRNFVTSEEKTQIGKISGIIDEQKETKTQMNNIMVKNAEQDFYIKGLFNENIDGRLSIEGEGNSVKLGGSKDGFAEIKSIKGNTLVNILPLEVIKKFQPDNQYIIQTGTWTQIGIWDKTPIKADTTYTFIIDIKEKPENVSLSLQINAAFVGINLSPAAKLELGINIISVKSTTTEIVNSTSHNYLGFLASGFTEGQQLVISKDMMMLEGNYTNKPIPQECFTGMISTFEDKLITQEQVDNGEEKTDDLGKYRVDLKIIGKNLYNHTFIDAMCDLNNWEGTGAYRINRKAYKALGLKKGVEYRCSLPDLYVPAHFYPIVDIYSSYTNTHSGSIIPSGRYNNTTDDKMLVGNFNVISNTSETSDCIVAYVHSWDEINMQKLRNVLENNIQLEERTNVTTYEPYREYRTSILLNSPLLKNDEICVQDGKLGHFHKSESIRILKETGFKISNIQGQSSVYIQKFKTEFTNPFIPNYSHITPSICNRFKTLPNSGLHNCENAPCVGITSDGFIRLILSFETLGIQEYNATDIYDWLINNPTTIVYTIAEPWFEPLVDDVPQWVLDSYNDCTLHIDSIIPVTNVNVDYTGNIPSVYGLEKTNENQDELINVSLCATDEMFMLLEPLISQQSINERMVSKMVDLYVAMVIRGLKTIDEVPIRYREQVKELLTKLEKE